MVDNGGLKILFLTEYGFEPCPGHQKSNQQLTINFYVKNSSLSVGRKHVAKYRVVLTDHRQSAKHGFIKVLDHMIHTQKLFDMDMEAAAGYIKNGAQYSDTFAKIVSKISILSAEADFIL